MQPPIYFKYEFHRWLVLTYCTFKSACIHSAHLIWPIITYCIQIYSQFPDKKQWTISTKKRYHTLTLFLWCVLSMSLGPSYSICMTSHLKNALRCLLHNWWYDWLLTCTALPFPCCRSDTCRWVPLCFWLTTPYPTLSANSLRHFI